MAGLRQRSPDGQPDNAQDHDPTEHPPVPGLYGGPWGSPGRRHRADQRGSALQDGFDLGGPGNKRYGGCTREAVSKMLTFGFTELGLHVVNAWTVEINIPAQRVLEALHFKYIGRQRQCYYIDDRPYDRLLFDLLATEHQEI